MQVRAAAGAPWTQPKSQRHGQSTIAEFLQAKVRNGAEHRRIWDGRLNLAMSELPGALWPFLQAMVANRDCLCSQAWTSLMSAMHQNFGPRHMFHLHLSVSPEYASTVWKPPPSPVRYGCDTAFTLVLMGEHTIEFCAPSVTVMPDFDRDQEGRHCFLKHGRPEPHFHTTMTAAAGQPPMLYDVAA